MGSQSQAGEQLHNLLGDFFHWPVGASFPVVAQQVEAPCLGLRCADLESLSIAQIPSGCLGQVVARDLPSPACLAG